MIFTITTDISVMKNILMDNFIFENSSDDFCTKDMEFTSIPFIGVTVENGHKLLGLFLLDPRNTIHYEIHTCLFKGLSAIDAMDIIKEGYVWLFGNFPVLKLSTYIPTFNKRAIRFAKFAGMKIEGVLTNSFQKNNKLYDQIIMGINKEVICQQ